MTKYINNFTLLTWLYLKKYLQIKLFIGPNYNTEQSIYHSLYSLQYIILKFSKNPLYQQPCNSSNTNWNNTHTHTYTNTHTHTHSLESLYMYFCLKSTYQLISWLKKVWESIISSSLFLCASSGIWILTKISVAAGNSISVTRAASPKLHLLIPYFLEDHSFLCMLN